MNQKTMFSNHPELKGCTVCTSHFKAIKQMPSDWRPVAICCGVPRWYRKGRYSDLAPRRDMLKLAREEFDARFLEMLEALDINQVLHELREKAMLLCWEGPNIWCHRRMVAEWIERESGLVVPELGFQRAEVLDYDAAPAK